jgi:modulator of FtsH protease HflC
MNKVRVPTILTAAALVVLLVVYMITFQVRFSEQAVRVRFGKLVPGAVEPGLHLRWPFLEQVAKYDVRLRSLDLAETELKTQDGQTLVVGCYALWRIKDPLQFHIRLGDEVEAQNRLRTRINQDRNAVIGRHNMTDFVNLDAEVVARGHDQMYREIRDAAAASLLADFGIELVEVGIRRISVPESTTTAILAAMSEERNAIAARYTEEGKALAQTITSSAESARRQIIAFVDNRAQEIESDGTKASQRILAQIKTEDAEFFVWLRYLEALKASLRQRTTIILDSSSDLYQIFRSSTPKAPTARPKGD